MNNIVLIGFMGCGKSTIGREVSKRANRWFIDSDDLIQSSENKTIIDIFETYGEEYFRKQEQKCLEWMISSVKNSIISTGGGMPIYCNNLKKLGKIIFLKTEYDTTNNRLKLEEKLKRPLIGELGFAQDMYEERLLKYTSISDVVIDANKDIKSVVQDVLQAIPSELS